jgi:hypothetical protein
MPALTDLLNNLSSFKYYKGYGNFTQKSIPFGNDRPGGGSSGQPYITRKIGQTWDIANDGTMPIGIIGTTERSVADVERIGKFFINAPNGPIFIAKQVGLQLSNPKLEQPKNASIPSTGLSGLPDRIKQDVGSTRVYNLGVNTLAQVGTVAFGNHFDRHGLSPNMDENDKYYRIVSVNNQDSSNSKINSDAGNRLVRYTANLLDSGQTTIDSYKGGPGSVYGIGNTTIYRSVDTIGNNSPTQTPINNFTPLKISDLAKIGRDGIFINSAGNDNQTTFDVTKQDFRELKNTLYRAGLPQSDYTTQNLSTRIGRGNPGRSGLDRSDYSVSLPGTQDTINQLSLFYSSMPPGTDSNIFDLNSGKVVNAPQVRDIIKFRIEAIDNDNPAFSVWMVFRATITDFNDNTDAMLESYKYSGRGENFYIYDGASSNFSFAFTIAAQSRDEMKPLYQKLNYLKSNLHPDYNGANKMRGPLIKLTIGDYIYRQPGWISSLNISIPNEAYWEIALNEPEGGKDANMHEVPMVLKVSMNFIPIYDFLPRKGASTPFISVNGRKSPSDPLSPPAPNNWLADSGITKNNDGTSRYTSLQDKISAARKKVLNA